MSNWRLSLGVILGLALLLPSLTYAALININSASQSELETITGVGEVIAGRIIEYRTTVGLFKTIEEIKNVKGIGDATFLKMQNEITVGGISNSSTENNDNNGEEESVAENTSTSGNFSNESSKTISAHASQTDVSTGAPNLAWKISAGRERIALVGAPLTFRAKTLSGNQPNPNFSWTFGDGGATYGELVKHTFLKPGRYQVVVNGLGNGEDAVARTVVLVVEPKIGLTIDQNLDAIIKNQQNVEINLGGFRLIATSTQIFELPPDTLIGAGEQIILDHRLTKLTPQSELILTSPAGEVIARSVWSSVPTLSVQTPVPVPAPFYSPQFLEPEPSSSSSVSTIILDQPKSSALARWFSWFKLIRNL